MQREIDAAELRLQRRIDELERDVALARTEAAKAVRLVLDVTRSSIGAALAVYRQAAAPEPPPPPKETADDDHP